MEAKRPRGIEIGIRGGSTDGTAMGAKGSSGIEIGGTDETAMETKRWIGIGA